MMLSELYKTIQSAPHGSSGRGISYWSVAATCGRKANLIEKHREQFRELDASESAGVGVYYHALMEYSLRGQLESEIWDQTDEMQADETWQEAVTLYRAYKSMWGSPLEKWSAECLGTEVPLPISAESKATLLNLFGERELTGRIDAVFRVHDVEAVQEKTGLLVAPGVYLVDWKTGSTLQTMDVWRYEHGLQAAAYQLMYNMEHPEEPAQGMIFDKIVRHKVITKKSFAHHVAYSRSADYRAVRSLVDHGHYNVLTDRTNPAACFEGYKPCPFYTLGLCDRF